MTGCKPRDSLTDVQFTELSYPKTFSCNLHLSRFRILDCETRFITDCSHRAIALLVISPKCHPGTHNRYPSGKLGAQCKSPKENSPPLTRASLIYVIVPFCPSSRPLPGIPGHLQAAGNWAAAATWWPHSWGHGRIRVHRVRDDIPSSPAAAVEEQCTFTEPVAEPGSCTAERPALPAIAERDHHAGGEVDGKGHRQG